MTLERTNELLAEQALTGDGYNRNGAGLILIEHGQSTLDQLITITEFK